MSMPTYSSTPFPPSIKDICVVAAIVLPRPLSKIGAAGVAGVVLMEGFVAGAEDASEDMVKVGKGICEGTAG